MRQPVPVSAARRRTPIAVTALVAAVAAALVAVVLTHSGGRPTVVGTAPASTGGAQVEQAQLLAGGRGWALATNGLYWTADGARSWSDVTPDGVPASTISGVLFQPDGHGWIVSSDTSGVHVARGVAGSAWRTSALKARTPAMGRFGPASLSFIDPVHGWLLLDADSHGPFAPGSLFRTSDGGATWSHISAPAFGSIHFVSSAVGFLAARANGPRPSTLYVTHDGGVSWTPAALPTPPRHGGDLPLVDAPPVVNGTTTTAVVGWVGNDGTRKAITSYASPDSGRTWSLVTDQDAPTGAAAVSWAGAAGTPNIDVVWSAPGRAWAAASADGGRSLGPRPTSGLPAVAELSLDGGRVWAVAPVGHTMRLYQSLDDGATWAPLRVG